jgi:hypothetical protein
MTEHQRPRRIYPPAQQPTAERSSPSDGATPEKLDGTPSAVPQQAKQSSERGANGGYEVGYGKPPTASRFKPGQSGNPKGRPKGAKGLQTLLREELNAKVVVHEHGKATRLTKQHIAIKRLVNRAAEGDHRAFRTVVELHGEMPESKSPAANDDRPASVDAETLAGDDRVILDDYIAKILEIRATAEPSPALPEHEEPEQPPRSTRAAKQ